MLIKQFNIVEINEYMGWGILWLSLSVISSILTIWLQGFFIHNSLNTHKCSTRDSEKASTSCTSKSDTKSGLFQNSKLLSRSPTFSWATCQIRKIMSCACAGNAGNKRHSTSVLYTDLGRPRDVTRPKRALVSSLFKLNMLWQWNLSPWQ